MESIKNYEKRKSENLHTLSELESAGNKIITISETDGYLVMKRGKTYTFYSLRTINKITYWTPINARSE